MPGVDWNDVASTSPPISESITMDTRGVASAEQRLAAFKSLEQLSGMVRSALEGRWSRGTDLLDSICHYALVPVGKLFRPVLLLESALAVGGDLAGVLPAAVGAECGHVASLIHDDIMDGDDLRRGRLSVQYKYGIGDAIVAGDALIFDLFASLAECRATGVPDVNVVSALDAVARAGIDLCRGQSLEGELATSLNFDIDAYLTVARLKTGSLFRGACECGAILGGGPPEWVQPLVQYGEQLGVAFQIQDDLLAYISDSDSMGKPQTSDVENGRPTLPIILAYERATSSDQDLIVEALSSGQEPVQTLAVLHEVLTRTGAIAAATQMARDCVTVAQQALQKLPSSASRDRLSSYAELVIERRA